MRVQLSEKSKAEFIELIAKDSITCWFEGDEFVMPSGQGKTAKGIVLGKLLVWRHRQTEVDELQKRVDDLTQVMEELLEEMKYPTATFEEVICSGVRELEQALKGGSNG